METLRKQLTSSQKTAITAALEQFIKKYESLNERWRLTPEKMIGYLELYHLFCHPEDQAKLEPEAQKIIESIMFNYELIGSLLKPDETTKCILRYVTTNANAANVMKGDFTPEIINQVCQGMLSRNVEFSRMD